MTDNPKLEAWLDECWNDLAARVKGKEILCSFNPELTLTEFLCGDDRKQTADAVNHVVHRLLGAAKVLYANTLASGLIDERDLPPWLMDCLCDILATEKMLEALEEKHGDPA